MRKLQEQKMATGHGSHFQHPFKKQFIEIYGYKISVILKLKVDFGEIRKQKRFT